MNCASNAATLLLVLLLTIMAPHPAITQDTVGPRVIDRFSDGTTELIVLVDTQLSNDPAQLKFARLGILGLRQGSQSEPVYFIVSRTQIFGLEALWAGAKQASGGSWQNVGSAIDTSAGQALLTFFAGPGISLSLTAPGRNSVSIDISRDRVARFDRAIAELKVSVTGSSSDAFKQLNAAKKAFEEFDKNRPRLDEIKKEADEIRRQALEPIPQFGQDLKHLRVVPPKGNPKQ